LGEVYGSVGAALVDNPSLTQAPCALNIADQFGAPSEGSPAGDFDLQIDGVRVTSVGLEIDAALDRPSWLSAVEVLARFEAERERTASAASWWLGDLIAFGAVKFDVTYREIGEVVGRSEQTVKNLAWVSRKVPPEVRDAELPWRTHKAVAPLDDHNEQRQLLALAKERGLSAEELLKVVREGSETPDEFPDAEPDPNQEQDFRCPNCAHEWSGDPRPEAEEAA
jgi:hypothetical protein